MGHWDPNDIDADIEMGMGEDDPKLHEKKFSATDIHNAMSAGFAQGLQEAVIMCRHANFRIHPLPYELPESEHAVERVYDHPIELWPTLKWIAHSWVMDRRARKQREKSH